LEFRIASDDDVTPETIAERERSANNILKEAQADPDHMVEYYGAKAAENIYAQTIS
jgi:hypothetical protein